MGYRDHAFQRAVVDALQRHLLEVFIASDTPAKQVIVAEDMPRNDSQVPQEALHVIYDKLQAWQDDERSKMSRFRWVEDPPVPPFLKPPKETKPDAAAPRQKSPAKQKRRRSKAAATKRPGGDDASGGTAPDS